MLPDFLKTKEKLKKMLDSERKKAEMLHLGPVADAPRSMIFEGKRTNRTVIIYTDAPCEEIKMGEVTSKLEVKWEEVETMTHETILNKIDNVAKEMAEQIKKSYYETLSEAAEEAGNVTSSDGKPLSVDMILEMVKEMHLSFDEKGEASGLTFAASPELYPALVEVIEQAKADPQIDNRFKALMEQKREEWRVRENNRELVG